MCWACNSRNNLYIVGLFSIAFMDQAKLWYEMSVFGKTPSDHQGQDGICSNVNNLFWLLITLSWQNTFILLRYKGDMCKCKQLNYFFLKSLHSNFFQALTLILDDEQPVIWSRAFHDFLSPKSLRFLVVMSKQCWICTMQIRHKLGKRKMLQFIWWPHWQQR